MNILSSLWRLFLGPVRREPESPVRTMRPVKYSRDWFITAEELRRREESAERGNFIPADADGLRSRIHARRG